MSGKDGNLGNVRYAHGRVDRFAFQSVRLAFPVPTLEDLIDPANHALADAELARQHRRNLAVRARRGRHLWEREQCLRDGRNPRELAEPLPAKAQEGGEQLCRIAEVGPKELAAELRFITENLRGDVRIAN